jgi:DNA-directed RNA polymerase subunit RPC12/RpoP
MALTNGKKNDNCLEGIECPHCASQGPFRVAVRVLGDALVSDDGIEELDRTETEFLDDIDWRCLNCGKDFDPGDNDDQREEQRHEEAECYESAP